MSCRHDRAGYTLAEALTALLVAGLLTLGLGAALAVVGRAAMRHAESVAAAETERTTPAILAEELRALTAADARFGGDSVRVRAFRGGGVVCARAGTMLTIAWAGVRQPEPDKDSLLLIGEDGESVHAIAASGAGSCGESSAVRVEALALDGASAAPLLGYVFETGSYSLSSSALRYRRGAAGRQPLTEETLTGASSLNGAAAGAATVAHVLLHSKDADGAPSLEWSLLMPQADRRPREAAQ